MYTHRFGQCFLGKTLVLDNGTIEFAVTLDVGPRIISLKALDGLNVMYEDIGDTISKDCSSVYGKEKKWHIYGGHRLWLSPEDLSTYYPDNNPVDYELLPQGVRVYPKKWENVEIQPEIILEFSGENSIKVTHKVINLGAKRKLCLWALSVLKAGGKMTFPLSAEDTGFLANRNIVMWPYSSFTDPRLKLADDVIVTKSDISVPEPFKIGTYKRDFYAEYEIERDGKTARFVKRAQGLDGAEYPDYGCNFECYFNDRIHEIESLSQVAGIENGGVIEHTEIWEIY